tara:strand:+ start:618 stop:821 length:204 start_codon:yes stop_codon:yes gene_type:complete
MTTLLFRDDVALVMSEFDAALDKYRDVLESKASFAQERRARKKLMSQLMALANKLADIRLEEGEQDV